MMKHLVLSAILLLQLTPNTTYHRETIDSLWQTKNTNIIITGTIAVLSINDQKQYTFRIGDEHGHFVSCTLPKGNPQPIIGIKFDIYGKLTKYTIPEHLQGIMDIAVDKIEPVE